MSRWVAAMLLLFAVESAFGARVPREILWIDTEHVQPMFIPEEFLNERSWDDLPWSHEAKATLEYYVERAPTLKRDLGGLPAPECQTLNNWKADPASYSATNFDAVLGSSAIAVTGKVLGEVAGWSTWRNQVVTMVYVRVTEVLRDVDANVKPGDVAIFSESRGDITVKGTRLCVNPQPRYYTPQAGDDVLLVGHRWEGDTRVVVSHLLHPVSAGRVSSRAFTRIETGVVALESVRAIARRVRETR